MERNPLWDRLKLDLTLLGIYGCIGAYTELVANHSGEKMTDTPGIVAGAITLGMYLANRMGPSLQHYQEIKLDMTAWRKYKGMKTSE